MGHKKSRIILVNIHGLLKGSGLEIGRDADNGGQTKYIYELADYLSRSERVEHVHIFTRLIDDKAMHSDYAKEIEQLNHKLDIRRIAFAGKKYKAKEQLWGHLDEFVSGAVKHIKQHNIFPNWIHSHYGDAGYCALELSTILNVPFAHTGHSLGRHKQSKVAEMGMTEAEGEKKFNFSHRIAAEEAVLEQAEFIVTSTQQEVTSYDIYDNAKLSQYNVLPPGIDTSKFTPYYQHDFDDRENEQEDIQRRFWVKDYIEKFLTNPHKPVILALSRPDRRKNLHKLIEIYGKDKELQSMANLIIFAGIRKDINVMPSSEKEVLTQVLLLMDKYDLYGKMAIPKKHDVENEVSLIYQYCAEKRGVFSNITLHENFGLTIIEAASSGLPVVVTKNGGPAEIIPKCQNGVLVDPSNDAEITKALHTILSDEEKWKSYSNNGIINVQKYFSWDSHVETYLNWVDENLDLSGGFGIKKKNFPGINISRLKDNVDQLLVSDIDGTLIEPSLKNPGLEELKEYLSNMGMGSSYALASGRNLELIKEVLEEYDMPKPEFVISSVGTEIFYPDLKGNYVPDKGWISYLNGRWKRDQILSILKQVKWLKLQGNDSQRDFKISFYYEKNKYDESELQRILGSHWYQLNVIVSHGEFLDVLPKRASKGNAIKFLSHKWSIPLRNVYAFGDSGNDVDMFRGAVNGVVVGNRSEELKDLKPRKNLYLAKEPAAKGILEGLRHFKVIK